MELNFVMYFQQGRGTVVSVCEENDAGKESGEYLINRIAFFRQNGDKIVSKAFLYPSDVFFKFPCGVSFEVTQPNFISRHRSFSSKNDEKAFLWMQPGGTHILCLDAESMQLMGPQYILLGEAVDEKAPFERIDRSIAAEWTWGKLDISFISHNYRNGAVEWSIQKSEYDKAVQLLKDVQTEEDYAAALSAVEEAHQKMVHLCKFWATYTVDDYIRERERLKSKV